MSEFGEGFVYQCKSKGLSNLTFKINDHTINCRPLGQILDLLKEDHIHTS